MHLKKILLSMLLLASSMTVDASCYNYSSDFSCLDFCGANPFEGWTVYGDWLYWRARRGSLDFAVPYDSAGLSDNMISISSGKVYEVCPNYDNGWRLGFQKNCGYWDFGMRYTTFNSDAKEVVKRSDGNLAKTRLDSPFGVISNGSMSYAEAIYKVDLRELDIELGWILLSNRCYFARLFTGFKSLFIEQDFDVLYGNIGSLSDTNDRLKYDQDLNAYGFYSGIEGSVAVLPCLNLFANASYGVYWGNLRNKVQYYQTTTQIDTATNTLVTTQTLGVNLRDKCHNYVNNTNIIIGAQYDLGEYCFINWTVSAGYEFHHFFFMEDFLDLTSSGSSPTYDQFSLDYNNNCIGFDGLFVRLTASF